MLRGRGKYFCMRRRASASPESEVWFVEPLLLNSEEEEEVG